MANQPWVGEADTARPLGEPTNPRSGVLLHFSAEVHDPDGTVMSTIWDFGDGSGTATGDDDVEEMVTL